MVVIHRLDAVYRWRLALLRRCLGRRLRRRTPRLEGGLLGTSLSTYGWAWIIVGVILVLSSVAVLAHSQFARWISIAAGALLAITAIWWIPFFPEWSLVYIMLGVLIVYGAAVHRGRHDAR